MRRQNAQSGWEQGYGDQPAWEERQPLYDPRPMDEMDQPYFDAPYQENASWETEPPAEPEIIATNGTVKLTCTLAAFCSLLALFFFFADRRSRAIRQVSVQSLGIGAVHMLGAALLILLGSLLGGIPFIGFLITILCWLLYIALAATCVFFRVKLMLAAYAGVKYTLPLLGEKLEQLLNRP